MNLYHTKRQQGLTIVEVLIALVVLSLIMAALVSALRSFGRTQAALDNVTGRITSVRQLSSFLRDSIGSAVPVMGATPDVIPGGRDSGVNSQNTLFWSDGQELIWAAPLAAGERFGGFYLLRMTLVNEQLQLRWQPYRRVQKWDDWDDIKPHVLLEDVEEIEFGFRPGYGEEWIAEWGGAYSNPVSVRMNLKVADRYWPELVIRLDEGRGSDI